MPTVGRCCRLQGQLTRTEGDFDQNPSGGMMVVIEAISLKTRPHDVLDAIAPAKLIDIDPYNSD